MRYLILMSSLRNTHTQHSSSSRKMKGNDNRVKQEKNRNIIFLVCSKSSNAGKTVKVGDSIFELTLNEVPYF